jgi:tetratricopeptide (TPR) repeat protein
MPFAALIASRHIAGLPVEALMAEALQSFPRHYGLQWMAGKLALESGALEAAKESFLRLAGIDAVELVDEEVAYDKALFTHTAQESLALTAFRAGDFAGAEAHYRQAAETSPDPAPLRIKAALAAAKILRPAEQTHAEFEAIAPE